MAQIGCKKHLDQQNPGQLEQYNTYSTTVFDTALLPKFRSAHDRTWMAPTKQLWAKDLLKGPTEYLTAWDETRILTLRVTGQAL